MLAAPGREALSWRGAPACRVPAVCKEWRDVAATIQQRPPPRLFKKKDWVRALSKLVAPAAAAPVALRALMDVHSCVAALEL